jgi:Ser/Thr protein kinase RdoA (MazF antagonist)
MRTAGGTQAEPLFQPDLFSNTSPCFVAVPEPSQALLQDVLKHHYPHLINHVTGFQQYKGNEINSNNFRIEAASGTYLLKRFPCLETASSLPTQLELYSWCLSRQVPVPRVHSDNHNKLLIDFSGQHWCLFDFVEGNFFSGANEELASTAQMIGRLHKTLLDRTDPVKLPNSWSYFASDEEGLFRELDHDRTRWPTLFGSDTAELLLRRWSKIQSTMRDLHAHETRIKSAPLRLGHADLHPHNILVHQGRLSAFLDFESLRSLPACLPFGFALYKLIRQHAVRESLASQPERISQQARSFVETLTQEYAMSREEISELKTYALLELFRRFMVIIRLNLRDHNTAWNHVFPMHLTGFSEIDIIFADLTH